jgi:MFS transporter, SP family, sugar:H+ symporter
MHDRDEEALRNLKLLRGEGNEVAAETELELIRVALREEADQGTWADLFKGHNRRRTGVVLGVAFFFQATGQVFSGHYGAVFVKSLGTVNPWDITVSQSAINTVTSFIGISLLDRVGRR